jgi:hypothetical protein
MQSPFRPSPLGLDLLGFRGKCIYNQSCRGSSTLSLTFMSPFSTPPRRLPHHNSPKGIGTMRSRILQLFAKTFRRLRSVDAGLRIVRKARPGVKPQLEFLTDRLALGDALSGYLVTGMVGLLPHARPVGQCHGAGEIDGQTHRRGAFVHHAGAARRWSPVVQLTRAPERGRVSRVWTGFAGKWISGSPAQR